MSKKKTAPPVPPMGVSSIEIDPITLRPIDQKAKAEKLEKQRKSEKLAEIDRAEADLAQAQMMMNQFLSSQTEESFILRTLYAALEQRTYTLMEADPECQGIIKVIRAVGYHVKTAPQMALQIIEESLGSAVRQSIAGAALQSSGTPAPRQ